MNLLLRDTLTALAVLLGVALLVLALVVL